MRIGVLGRLQVVRDGVEVDLGSRKQRVLLAGLALTPNRVVSADALIEMIWGDQPPPAVAASLHGYVAALRRALEPGRAARDRPQVLITRPSGYELQVQADQIDAVRFTAAVSGVHDQLADTDPLRLPEDWRADDLGAAESALQAALALWRGSPLAELLDHPAATAERARLEDLRLVALRDLARVRLARGKHAAVAADLDALTRTHPLREDLWGLRALALARGGRQAEALDTLRAARSVLAEELGIDPGPSLRDLEMAILRQDPSVHGHQHPPGLRPHDGGTRAGHPPSVAPVRPPGATGLPLVGRDVELAALDELVREALSGMPRLASITGEPGIGKTRLTQALAVRAADRGFTVLVGQCSQDQASPPLWPWIGLLRSLAATWPQAHVPDLEGPGASSGSVPAAPTDRFRTFDAVARLLIGLSAEHPLLLILEDLHWADPSSLHLLRHLVEVADQGRLLVVMTRRSAPGPPHALATLGEALARRGAFRLDLRGLSLSDVEVLAEAATGSQPDPAEANGLRERTGGNPFFIVEVLRLGGHSLQLLDRGSVPAAVGDVIAARVGQLPSRSQQLLRDASVLGRSVDLDLLSQLSGRPQLDLLDDLEPALAAGMVAEASDGSLQFSHALVRDAVYGSVPALRRQLRHADVARLLEGVDPARRRPSDIARHWLRAGPSHAARAWRAAVEAAGYASRLQAHEEAAELLAAALDAQALDAAAGPGERYDLLMARARACRAAANGDEQRAATAEAIRLARDADDIERVALAAITGSEGALWSNRPLGEVDPPTVEALQLAVRELPGGDTPLRCRAFLALSRELYWAPQPREREAHAELGLAMARRLGDPQLHAWACHTAFVGTLRPDTMHARLALAAEAVSRSRQAGDPEGETTGLLFSAIVAGEAGMLGEREQAVNRALALAERHRLRYLQVMLGSYEAPWLALQGRFAAAERLYADSVRWAAHASFPFRREALAGARLCLDIWQGRVTQLLSTLRAVEATGPVDLGSAILLLLLRSGRPAEVAEHLERRPPVVGDDTFDAPMLLALCAEAALVLRRPTLAAEVYPLLAPWEGRFASAGTGTPLGPVECFLALAAAAVGETDLAGRHADRALELCDQWQLVPVTAWLGRHRRSAGF